MDIEQEFNFKEINKINNNMSNYNSLNEIQLTTEDTSSKTDDKKETFINKTNKPLKFGYKRAISERSYSSIISSCERRLIKDKEELEKNENIGKLCEILVHNYKKITDSNDFEMIIEFKNYFSLKFIFTPDYPFSPPLISYYSGVKFPYIFDTNGNILLENTQKSKWTPIIWLSTLVHSIELLISENCKNSLFVPKAEKYGKRKWNDYLKEEKKSLTGVDSFVLNQLDRNLKGVKPFTFN